LLDKLYIECSESIDMYTGCGKNGTHEQWRLVERRKGKETIRTKGTNPLEGITT
jgi:hypothetical protein